MRILVISRIFPDCEQPGYASYNRRLYGELGKIHDVEVWGLIPFFPGQRLIGKADRRGVPEEEVIDGLVVKHPRVLYAPKAGRPLSGALYVASLAGRVLEGRGRWDAIVGSFAYPDGWAAVALGRRLGVPAVVQVLGSDVNVYGSDPLLAPLLRWAFSRSAAVVGPSRALVDAAVELGAPVGTSTPIPNGVDVERFHPRDRGACRVALGHGDDDRRWILFVGRLEEAKGLWELLEAFERVHRVRDDTHLVLVGDGVDREACERRARDRGLPVTTTGARGDVELWFGACDVFTLPSWREGTPNVVLEAMASGRRVVTSDVGGIPVVVHDPRLGTMVPPRSPRLLADALLEALAEPYDPHEVAECAAIGTWADSARVLSSVLEQSVGGR
ncbi:MAG: glycosyltransferase [Polyangiaceae bacterium]